MKYYIVDDVITNVKILDRIIEQKDLGEVIGFNTDAEMAVKEIITKNPNIVFADLLMPVKDGITLVREVRRMRPNMNFIMISQVSDKDMVAEAYKSGVEFFIHKPINIIEVETVARRVAEKIRMESMLVEIREMIQSTEGNPAASIQKKSSVKDIKYLFSVLGMLGERGTKDLLHICETLIAEEKNYDEDTISDYGDKIGEDAKIIKQRMRRAVKKGLTNIATLRNEDYYNELFQSYSYMIFDSDSIRSEMDFLKGKASVGGRVNLDKFIEGLLIFNEMKE